MTNDDVVGRVLAGGRIRNDRERQVVAQAVADYDLAGQEGRLCWCPDLTAPECGCSCYWDDQAVSSASANLRTRPQGCGFPTFGCRCGSRPTSRRLGHRDANRASRLVRNLPSMATRNDAQRRPERYGCATGPKVRVPDASLPLRWPPTSRRRRRCRIWTNPQAVERGKLIAEATALPPDGACRVPAEPALDGTRRATRLAGRTDTSATDACPKPRSVG